MYRRGFLAAVVGMFAGCLSSIRPTASQITEVVVSNEDGNEHNVKLSVLRDGELVFVESFTLPAATNKRIDSRVFSSPKLHKSGRYVIQVDIDGANENSISTEQFQNGPCYRIVAAIKSKKRVGFGYTSEDC